MTTTFSKLVLATSLLMCFSAHAVVRIDASSDAAAQESFQQMLNELATTEKSKLITAMIQLNLVGVQSAYEVVGNPELQSPSPARVKDKIAGMTADEIIDLANRTSTVKARVKDQQ